MDRQRLMEAAPEWRAEDEALYERLLEERAARELWRFQAPEGAGPAPKRAAVIAGAARRLEGGAAAIDRAAAGDPSGLVALVAPERYTGLPGDFVHAVAVWYDRLAAAWASCGGDRRDAESAEASARVRSVAAWIAAREERRHLAALGARLAQGSLSAADAEAAALGAATRCFDDLAAIAAGDARTLGARGRVALAVLGRAGEAARMAGVGAAAAASYVARADAIRARVIDDALAPTSDALAELRAKDDGHEHAWAFFERVRDVWEWSGRDEAVERFAVENVTHFAWLVYRTMGWPELRKILAPCTALYESLEARILRDPMGHLAYAASCAQMLVFLSESSESGARSWEYAERALRVCPSHRNGRLVLASLCCDRAIRTLDGSTLFTGRADVEEAQRLVVRAEELFPQSGRLADAKAKLAEAKGRWAL